MLADDQLFLSINGFARATPFLQPVVLGYASYGLLFFAGLIVAGWWVARRRGDVEAMAAAVWVPLGALLAIALNQPIADLVGEARPYDSLPDIFVLAQRSTDPSFPSDHAVLAGAVAAGLFLVSRRLGIVAAMAAVLMAFSRVYIAAHFPGDVAAGLLLGAVVSLVGFALVRPLLRRLLVMAEGTTLRPLITSTQAVGISRSGR